MRIDWTPEALSELAAIEAYIAQDSLHTAKAMVWRLIERCEQLAVAPQSAPRLPRYERDDLRMLFERPSRIVYQIHADRIEVITLWHYRQREPRDIPAK